MINADWYAVGRCSERKAWGEHIQGTQHWYFGSWSRALGNFDPYLALWRWRAIPPGIDGDLGIGWSCIWYQFVEERRCLDVVFKIKGWRRIQVKVVEMQVVVEAYVYSVNRPSR